MDLLCVAQHTRMSHFTLRWTKGRGTTAVPSHFFKVISYCSDPDTTNASSCPVEQLKSVAFLSINSREPVPEVHIFVLVSVVQCVGALCLACQTLHVLDHTRAVRCEGRHDACHYTCHPVMHGITLVTP